MNTPQLYELFLKYPKICIDSRKAEKGALFFALKGDNFDGNKFAEKALEKCEFAIVDDQNIVKDDKYIIVEDALSMLQNLAKYHRKRLGLPIIAITGTNGKTTTKELIAIIMSTKYTVGYTQGNFNNHIGVPLTLLSFNSEHEFGIVEMGANHIGEIAMLCKIIAPDFGIITNVGKAHIEGFGSFEGVKKAKAELYQYLYENDGVAFVNYDNELLEDMNPPHSIIYYGTKGFTHCQGRIEENGIYLKLRYIGSDDEINENEDIDWAKKGKLINTKLFGQYNFENVMAAISVADNFKIPKNLIIKAIENYSPDNNRSEILDTDANKLVIDSYNANPTSMKVALEDFNQVSFDNKIVVLGDMFELGDSSVREHGSLIGLIEKMNFEKVILVGENFFRYNDHKEFVFLKETDDLIEYLSANKLSGKSILIKGSRGMKMERIISYL